LKQTKKTTAFRPAICNRGSDGQFNLCPGSALAPDIQLAAYLPGALSHSGQTIMTGTALFQNFEWNTLPVVPNAQLEFPLSIGNFGFDTTGAGVAERVPECFATDTVKLIAYDRMQISRYTFND
jgi:hypothetical protein